MDFLEGLPARIRPTQLALRHPHIVNRLADIWSSVGVTERYFDSLLLSDRHDRQGFSVAVFEELHNLLEYRLSLLPVPAVRDVWLATPGLCRGGL